MPVDHEAIRAHHCEITHVPYHLCCECSQGWPCDAIQLLDEVERLEKKTFTLREEAEWILREGERDEEITHLREALEKIRDKRYGRSSFLAKDMRDIARAALHTEDAAAPEPDSVEIVRLREAGFDVIRRIEEWESAVRKTIGHQPKHGMDLTQLRAALAPAEKP